MKRLIQWLRKLKAIVANYDSDRAETRAALRRAEQAEQVIRDRTTLAVDADHRGGCYVVAMGRCQGRDYVQTYHLSDTDFRGFIDYLRSMERYGTVRYMDAPPAMRAVWEREAQTP